MVGFVLHSKTLVMLSIIELINDLHLIQYHKEVKWYTQNLKGAPCFIGNFILYFNGWYVIILGIFLERPTQQDLILTF